MRIIGLLAVAAAIAAAMLATGCSDNQTPQQEAQTKTIETRAGEKTLLTAAEANALGAKLLTENAFIDVDFDVIDVKNINLETPIEEVVKCKVAFHRFYSNIGIRDQRYYIKKNASELNVSDATYHHFEQMIEHSNSFITEELARGRSFEDIMAYQPDFAKIAADKSVPQFF